MIRDLEQAIDGLSNFLHRGNYPKELLDMGIRAYREISLWPYRVIYHVVENTVSVMLLADGRRNMRELL